MAASNYASLLLRLNRFEEARSMLHQLLPVARRVLEESSELALMMRSNYGMALQKDDGATLDDLRENVAMLEDADRIARRVLGSAHPTAVTLAAVLRKARAALRARETPSPRE